jgi:hypothetical protein
LTEAVVSALASDIPVQVIVSDNGSVDTSLTTLRNQVGDEPRLLIVENNANLGFAAGNNIVLEKAVAPTLLFMNPDLVVNSDSLRIVRDTLLASPTNGMAGPLIINLDGSEQRGCRRMIPTPWRALSHFLRLDRIPIGNRQKRLFNLTEEPLPERAVEVEAISGAFMMVTRQALNMVGPLDEGYFMHCEDLDWCVRFRAAGIKVLFTPMVRVVHQQGTCSTGSPFKVEQYKARGMVRFYNKFYKDHTWVLLRWGVIAAVYGRLGITFVKTRILQAQ